jgi:hypothetical protein
MKCRLIAATLLLNAEYSRAAAQAAKDAGKPYDVPVQIEVEPGYVMDHPDVWIHCCPGDLNSDPIAEPVDDECREAVRVWMNEKRPAAIASIKAQLDQIDLIKDEGHRNRLKQLARAYGVLPGTDGKQSKSAKQPDGTTV